MFTRNNEWPRVILLAAVLVMLSCCETGATNLGFWYEDFNDGTIGGNMLAVPGIENGVVEDGSLKMCEGYLQFGDLPANTWAPGVVRMDVLSGNDYSMSLTFEDLEYGGVLLFAIGSDQWTTWKIFMFPKHTVVTADNEVKLRTHSRVVSAVLIINDCTLIDNVGYFGVGPLPVENASFGRIKAGY